MFAIDSYHMLYILFRLWAKFTRSLSYQGRATVARTLICFNGAILSRQRVITLLIATVGLVHLLIQSLRK